MAMGWKWRFDIVWFLQIMIPSIGEASLAVHEQLSAMNECMNAILPTHQICLLDFAVTRAFQINVT
jgi:hypothetical protein